MNEQAQERRSERRVPGEGFYSVEVSIPELNYVYQFSLWNLSQQGLCVLIRMDSPVLEHLHMGAVLEMKFYGPGSSDPPRVLNAEIKHVSPVAEGRFRNHTLVGLSLLEANPPASPPES